MTSTPIAMRRRACASGAARRWSDPTSQRSRCGLTGPMPRPRRRLPRPREITSTAGSFRGTIAMAPKVLIFDALSPAAVGSFKKSRLHVEVSTKLRQDQGQLCATIHGFDGLAIRSATKVTDKLLDHAKNLKVIGRAGIGIDNVDIAAATARGIIVMNTPFGNSITTAEHAISLMLALARQIPEADSSTRAG